MYDVIIQRIQATMSLVPVYGIDAKGKLQPWYTIDPKDVLTELIINNHKLREQVDTAALWMAYWGRITAHTRRCFDIAEREYRDWRSRYVLKILADVAASEGKKKPTEAEIEARYRSDVGYAEKQTLVEATQEANLFADMVYQAHRARIGLLQADVRRAPDGSLQRLSV